MLTDIAFNLVTDSISLSLAAWSIGVVSFFWLGRCLVFFLLTMQSYGLFRYVALRNQDYYRKMANILIWINYCARAHGVFRCLCAHTWRVWRKYARRAFMIANVCSIWCFRANNHVFMAKSVFLWLKIVSVSRFFCYFAVDFRQR